MPIKDIGCDNFERAEYNRFIVKHKLFTAGYREVEEWFAHNPISSPLPKWMPLGSLPTVGKKDWQQSGGGQDGSFGVVELEVVVGT